jgi:hypothetical protein
MRYLHYCKSIKGTTSRCQKLQDQVKPAQKIHFVDFKRIEEEKQKKNGISKAQLISDEWSRFLIQKKE